MFWSILPFRKSLIHNLFFCSDYGYNLTMRYLSQRYSNRYIISGAIVALIITLWAGVPLYAQNTNADPAQAAPDRPPEGKTAEQKIQDNLDRDIEHYAKARNKRECARQSQLFTAAVEKYKEGVPVNEVTDVKMFEPLFENIYATLREKGIDQASMDNMREFQNCMDTVKQHRDPEREYDMAVKYGGCKKLNAMILDTLQAIKDGQSVDSVMNKYQAKKLSLSGTQYEKLENPALFFIGKIYKVAQDGEYSDAVQVGSNISTACML